MCVFLSVDLDEGGLAKRVENDVRMCMGNVCPKDHLERILNF